MLLTRAREGRREGTPMTQMPDPFDLVRRLGIEVLESETLRASGVFYREHGLAVIRTGLDHYCRHALADQILAALAAPAPSRPDPANL